MFLVHLQSRLSIKMAPYCVSILVNICVQEAVLSESTTKESAGVVVLLAADCNLNPARTVIFCDISMYPVEFYEIPAR